MGFSNKFPWSNMHGFNLDWIIETVKANNTKVENLEKKVDDFEEQTAELYETKENISEVRKLSNDGDFTGTLCNKAKTACEVVQDINGNIEQIAIIEDQINQGIIGQTLLINCGYISQRDGTFNTVINCGLISQRIGA